MENTQPRKIVIVGGGGHIGLPFGLILAGKGHEVIALDINPEVVNQINSGTMPFREEGADDLLKQTLKAMKFKASTDKKLIASAEVIVICIGTPVDEYFSPVPRIFNELLDSILPYLNSNQ